MGEKQTPRMSAGGGVLVEEIIVFSDVTTEMHGRQALYQPSCILNLIFLFY